MTGRGTIQFVKRKTFFSVTILFIFLVITSFTKVEDIAKLALIAQLKLNNYYDYSYTTSVIKKLDLKITDDGFLRCRKTFADGKVEYHSLNVTRLTTVNYLGNDRFGNLVLKTIKDDIIVQTYHDRRGDVDSMSAAFTIPLKGISAEDLVVINNNLLEMKKQLQ